MAAIKCSNGFEPAISHAIVPLSDCKEFDLEIFSCTTRQFLLGQYLEIFGTSCILLVIFTRTYPLQAQEMH